MLVLWSNRVSRNVFIVTHYHQNKVLWILYWNRMDFVSEFLSRLVKLSCKFQIGKKESLNDDIYIIVENIFSVHMNCIYKFYWS